MVFRNTAATYLDEAFVAETSPDLDFDGTNVGIVWTRKDFFAPASDGWNISGIGYSPALNLFQFSESPISTAPGDQVSPVVEYYGRDYLVAWQDNREGNWDIYGAVVFSNGVVRDTAGVKLGVANNDQVSPDLAFDGTRVLLVWQDFRAGTTSDIYGARWSPSVGLLDLAGIPISTPAGNQESPSVASSSPFLVAWHDRRSGTDSDVYGTRVRGDGSLADASGLSISAVHGGVNEQLAGVGVGNGRWLTTYEGGGNIFARTVSAK